MVILRQPTRGDPFMQLSVSHGGSLYYETIDLTPPWRKPAPTVLFCQGVGTNCEIWTGWLKHLVPHFRIARFDARGFGRSSKMPTAFPWSFELWTQDICAVADAVGAPSFHLIAEAMAGVVALQLAAGARGDRVLSVTTCSSPYRGRDLPRVGDWKARLRDEGVSAWSERMMEQRFHAAALAPDARAWFAQEQAASDADTLAALGDLLLEADLSDALPRIAAPVLLIAADSSPYVSVEVARSMKDLLKDAYLKVIPNSRHGIPFSHADECAAAFLEFAVRRAFIERRQKSK